MTDTRITRRVAKKVQARDFRNRVVYVPTTSPAGTKINANIAGLLSGLLLVVIMFILAKVAGI